MQVVSYAFFPFGVQSNIKESNNEGGLEEESERHVLLFHKRKDKV
jgi:hypothetical protein